MPNKFSGLSAKTLGRLRRQAENQLMHKLTVAARHEPGTAYHTRATLEAETYQNRIAAIDEELERR